MTIDDSAKRRLDLSVLRMRFAPETEAQFRADYARAGVTYRSELLLVGVGYFAILLIAFAVAVNGTINTTAVAMFGTAIGTSIGFRLIDRATKPPYRWSSAFFTLAVYAALALVMLARIFGSDDSAGVPSIVPATILAALMVAGLRVRILIPVMSVGLAATLAAEWFAVPDPESPSTILTGSIVTLLSMAATVLVERSTRAGWQRDRRLAQLSLTDALTGLPTRHALDLEIEHILGAELNVSIALAILDLDDFKGYNSDFGHVAGDECLRTVGKYLRDATDGNTEFIARLAGEEFVVLWHDVAPAAAAERLEILRRGVTTATAPEATGLPRSVTASAGFAAHDGRQEMPRGAGTALLREADRALYRAKYEGRDRTAHIDGPVVVSGSSVSERLTTTAATGTYNLVRGAELPFDLERQFHGSLATRAIRYGSVVVLLITALWLAALATEALRSGSVLGGRPTAWAIAAASAVVTVAVIVAISSRRRLHTLVAPVYLGSIAVLMVVLIVGQPRQLEFGVSRDMQLAIAGLAVLVCACVVLVKVRILIPIVLTILTVVTTINIAVAELTSERIVMLISAWFLISGALRFAHRIEGARRLAWIRAWQLDELSRIDPMSGLPNRRVFTANLAQALKSEAEHVAVILVDVDHFKQFNDRFGHLAGDNCLRRIGRALARISASQGAVLSRIGGDEFAVAVSGDDHNRLCQIASQMVAEVAALRISATTPMTHTTVSAGIAFHSGPRDTAEPADRLLERADRALYQAKHHGRGRVVIAPPEESAPVEPDRP